MDQWQKTDGFIHSCFIFLDSMTGVVVVVLICDFLASKTDSLGLPLFFGGSGYVGSCAIWTPLPSYLSLSRKWVIFGRPGLLCRPLGVEWWEITIFSIKHI